MVKIESELADTKFEDRVDHIIKVDRNQTERYLKVDKLRKDSLEYSHFLKKEKILFFHSIHTFSFLLSKLSNHQLLSILSLSLSLSLHMKHFILHLVHKIYYITI